MKDLTFLTRDGCVNTPDMVNNLDDALIAMKLPKDYQLIDIGKLRRMTRAPATRRRRSSGKGKTS